MAALTNAETSVYSQSSVLAGQRGYLVATLCANTPGAAFHNKRRCTSNKTQAFGVYDLKHRPIKGKDAKNPAAAARGGRAVGHGMGGASRV